MSEARQEFGRWGEEAAAAFLRRRGWKILARNLRTPVGEIDIVIRRGRILGFVEVKTRRSTAFGTPQEAVGAAKQRQILRAAQWYLADQGQPALQPRFDVVAVMPDAQGRPCCEHLENAFEA